MLCNENKIYAENERFHSTVTGKLLDLSYDYHQDFKKQNDISDADHMAVELDVSDSAAVRNLLQTTLKQYKAPPTIIVNSAGITRDNWLLKLSEEDYDSVVNTNLKVTWG